MLIESSLSAYLDRVASGEPTPGGGSVAALQGAAAAALTAMAARVTVGRRGFEAIEDRMKAIIEQALVLQKRLIQAVDADAESYRMVLAAFRMPKGTDPEKKAREKEIQKAFKQAARVPLRTAENALEAIRLAQPLVTAGNPNAATDALTAVLAARSAVLAACYTVRINLASIEDENFVARTSQKTDGLMRQAIELEKKIRASFDV